MAAKIGHNPEFFTDRTPPPPVSSPKPIPLLDRCGITDWDGFVADCASRRRAGGRPVGRWSGPCLDAALQAAVVARHWPADRAAAALLAVAADPDSRSPMRLAEAGPWWDETEAAAQGSAASVEEVEAAVAQLEELGGLRPLLQQQARDELRREGVALCRASVSLRAVDIFRARAAVSAGQSISQEGVQQ